MRSEHMQDLNENVEQLSATNKKLPEQTEQLPKQLPEQKRQVKTQDVPEQEQPQQRQKLPGLATIPEKHSPLLKDMDLKTAALDLKQDLEVSDIDGKKQDRDTSKQPSEPPIKIEKPKSFDPQYSKSKIDEKLGSNAGDKPHMPPPPPQSNPQVQAQGKKGKKKKRKQKGQVEQPSPELDTDNESIAEESKPIKPELSDDMKPGKKGKKRRNKKKKGKVEEAGETDAEGVHQALETTPTEQTPQFDIFDTMQSYIAVLSSHLLPFMYTIAACIAFILFLVLEVLLMMINLLLKSLEFCLVHLPGVTIFILKASLYLAILIAMVAVDWTHRGLKKARLLNLTCSLLWQSVVFILNCYFYTVYLYSTLRNLNPSQYVPDIPPSWINLDSITSAGSKTSEDKSNLNKKCKVPHTVADCDIGRVISRLKALSEKESPTFKDVTLAIQCYICLAEFDKAEALLAVIESSQSTRDVSNLRKLVQQGEGIEEKLKMDFDNNMTSACAIMLVEYYAASSKMFQLTDLIQLKMFSSRQNNPVNVYVQALINYTTGNYYEAEVGFRKCFAMNYKLDSCKDLAAACWRYRYTFVLVKVALKLNDVQRCCKLLDSLADIPNKNVFSFYRIKLEEAKVFLSKTEFSACLAMCCVYGAGVPSLASRFLCLQAEAHIKLRQYDAARDILVLLGEDEHVGIEASYLLRDVKEVLKARNVKTNYTILGVDRTATEGEIKDAFRRMAKETHPDKFQGDEKLVMEQRMKELNAAYLVLKDRSLRQEYDRTLDVEEEGTEGSYKLRLEECSAEIQEAAIAWWTKRTEIMKKKRTPRPAELQKFMESYLDKNLDQLSSKYDISQDELRSHFLP